MSFLLAASTADGHALNFDRVIMACHSDTTLSILLKAESVITEEEHISGRFAWNRNQVAPHNDVSVGL